MRRLFTEAVFYSFASGIALAVDMGLLWILVEWLHWSYLAAAAQSFLAGTGVVYVLSVGFVFRHRRVSDRRIEFGAFVIIGILGLATNLAVLKIAVDVLGVHYMIAKLCSVVFTFTLNFGLRRFFLFTSRQTTGKPSTTGGLAG